MKELHSTPTGAPSLRPFLSEESGRLGVPEGAIRDVLDKDRRAAPTGFYRGAHVPDFLEARCWQAGKGGLSGTQANQAITELYATFDRGMTVYLGEPRQANWTTFGKFASRNAGEQIARLEAVERVVEGKSLTALGALAGDFLRHPIGTVKKFWSLFRAEVPGEGFMGKTRLLRDALVNGNTDIIADIGPAYDTFLRAASAGQDGLAALRTAGYGQGKKDPQGFILKAFEKYVEARRIGDELKTFSPEVRKMLESSRGSHAKATVTMERHIDSPEGRRALELQDQRMRLINEGNLLLGIQEQWFSLQTTEVFDHPKVRQVMEALSKDMALVDATGPHKLLRFRTGNWAEFKTRMGFEEVARDAKLGPAEFSFELREPDGTVRRYKATTECNQGDIASYMETGGASGWHSNQLLDRAPGRLSGGFDRERLFGRFIDKLKERLPD